MQAKAPQEAVQSLRCQLSDTAAAPVQLELQAEQTASINGEQVRVSVRAASFPGPDTPGNEATVDFSCVCVLRIPFRNYIHRKIKAK